MSRISILRQILIAFAIAAVLMPASRAQEQLPNTGQQITPLAPTGARFEPLNPGFADNPLYTAGQAVTTVVSPDGNTLLVLTSGYNLVRNSSTGAVNTADSTQFVFVYNISGHVPIQTQVIQVNNTYNGIAFDPSGTAFYVSGGVNDNIHVFALQAGVWSEAAGSPISLGHVFNPATDGAGVGLEVAPQAAGIAITQNGTELVVANYYNDSISILTKSGATWAVSSELDLRPGKENPVNAGVPGGEYPLWVVISGNNTAYVSSLRDREVDVVNIASPTAPSVIARISVPGEPNRMVLNAKGTMLYVAQDNTDSVGMIDTKSNLLLYNLGVTATPGLLLPAIANFKGSNTNSITLSTNGKLLYLTNGWMNDIAVVQIGTTPSQSQVIGLIPTGWCPNSVSFSKDGKFMYVVNGKSPTGANPGYCHGITSAGSAPCAESNQYDLMLIKAGFQSFPTPTTAELATLTQQVATNNNFQVTESAADASMMAFLHSNIQHVIYIIKENRTYDQILGDLEVGNGDPSLTEFGAATTPNYHNIARNFVTLDNFYDTSEVSMDGWPWSTAAHANDAVEKQTPVEYAGRGLGYDSEGTNRNINVGYDSLAARLAANPLSPNDPDVMAGTADTAAPDGVDGEQGAGFLWNGALNAGLTLRNYGFFVDQARYNLGAPYTSLAIPELTNPAATFTQVAYSTNATLRAYTDPYFRGFDMTFPDYYRYTEWEREFNTMYAKGGLPNLTLLRIPHDHTGNFSIALNGVNTPELDEADNDYAVGLVVQKIAGSKIYKSNTLIFVIEDDAQDGGDHVDAHRSTAYIIGPYVKHKAVVSTSYNTLSMYRTIEDILGISYSNLNDALATPMADVFDSTQTSWNYKAVPSSLLCTTTLPIPATSCPPSAQVLHPTHDAAYWAAATKGMDFSKEDQVDGAQFNRILWKGLMGSKPYPATPSGLDLRANRAQLLELYRANSEQAPVQPSQKLAEGTGGGQ
ncbi:MAG TPA: bifunctional YncE family protein/alkaline phosphatase family protein [Terriglobia bacterium]|nr:bifunctional YncE family protein/alkaline phosphatase family protein [Terriglobia bacterium]